jgi:hypothetical protein
MVSVDPPATNKVFIETYCPGFPFPVVSDVGGKAAALYGVLRTESGVNLRGMPPPARGAFTFASTTYIGPDGTIIFSEDMQQTLSHITRLGRDIAVKLKQLGVKTIADAATGATGAQLKTIELGQTFEQVEAILGKPDTIARLGLKTIYSYKNLKVLFTAGKVSDVQ